VAAEQRLVGLPARLPQVAAAGADAERLVDRPPVVVPRRAVRGAVDGREHASAAIAGDEEPCVADALRRFLAAGVGHLIAPRRDAADAERRATAVGVGKSTLRAPRSPCWLLSTTDAAVYPPSVDSGGRRISE